jgi:hypothetical protein
MSGRGSRELAKYKAEHQKLGPVKAIHAKCADCVCDYADGRADCECQECPLYPYMPYGKARKAEREASKGSRPGAGAHLRKTH